MPKEHKGFPREHLRFPSRKNSFPSESESESPTLSSTSTVMAHGRLQRARDITNLPPEEMSASAPEVEYVSPVLSVKRSSEDKKPVEDKTPALATPEDTVEFLNQLNSLPLSNRVKDSDWIALLQLQQFIKVQSASSRDAFYTCAKSKGTLDLKQVSTLIVPRLLNAIQEIDYSKSLPYLNKKVRKSLIEKLNYLQKLAAQAFDDSSQKEKVGAAINNLITRISARTKNRNERETVLRPERYFDIKQIEKLADFYRHNHDIYQPIYPQEISDLIEKYKKLYQTMIIDLIKDKNELENANLEMNKKIDALQKKLSELAGEFNKNVNDQAKFDEFSIHYHLECGKISLQYAEQEKAKIESTPLSKRNSSYLLNKQEISIKVYRLQNLQAVLNDEKISSSRDKLHQYYLNFSNGKGSLESPRSKLSKLCSRILRLLTGQKNWKAKTNQFVEATACSQRMFTQRLPTSPSTFDADVNATAEYGPSRKLK